MQRKQTALARVPSSSSPLPDRGNVATHPPASPSPKKRAEEDLSAPDAGLMQEPDKLDVSESAHSLVAENDNFSEFGDVELDIDFLETIEMTATQMVFEKELVRGHVQNCPVALESTVLGAEVNDRLRREEDMSPSRQNNVKNALWQDPPSPKISIQQESDDEFAIEDDTAFATDMQDLAEQYDTQNSPFHTYGPVPQPRQVNHLDSVSGP